MSKPFPTAGKIQPATPPVVAKSNVAKSPPPTGPGEPVPPLYRRIDWITFWIVTLLSLAGYLFTVAPDLTLEDSGELATGSMYAGIPHPPGYPVWTVYTWLFTKLLPFSNIAWRVAVSSAVASAFACGLVGLLISRGSSMILESIDWFRDIDRRNEGWICLVGGVVGGLLLGFNGYIWSQAVIVEVYTLGVFSLMCVLACLFRWMYAPHQHRYLYWAFFHFGLCFCNHQTLLVGAMGIQVLIAYADRRIGRDLFLSNAIIWLAVHFFNAVGTLNTFRDNPGISPVFNLVGIGSACAAVWMSIETRGILDRSKVVLLCGLCFAVGAGFYFYMPLAGMTNPPLQWGYPRTWEGFIHALTRGQYEKTNPGISISQLWMYAEGCAEEFNFANLLIGLVPFVFWQKIGRRERGWLVGLTAIYLCLAVVLLYLLNPTNEKQSKELVKVFFTSSHVLIAIGVGYGIALIAACLLCRFEETRYWLLLGGAVACATNLYEAVRTFSDTHFAILRAAAVLSLVLSGFFLLLVLIQRRRANLVPFLAIFLFIPTDSILSHWADNEQRGHLFGFWFGHDMFDTSTFKGTDGKPLYPEMARDAVLFGGTDPGRFNPTYMIFCESFIKARDRRDPNFDRRDVALITQNALADLTYLMYIRAHYNRSAQVDPPFFQEMFRGNKNRTLGRYSFLSKISKPLDDLFLALGDRIEKRRRVGPSFFTADHFQNLDGFKAKIAAAADPLSKYLKDTLGSDATANARTLAKAMNKLIDGPLLYETNRLSGRTLSERTQRFIAQDLKTHNLVRLNRLLLEECYDGLIHKSPGGLYPDLEVITPTIEDSNKCFQEYMYDAQRRMAAKQLKPGEQVVQTPDGRVSVSGQVAVMSINALLCKVIFDKNPQNEFYIEESFPLDWMYPYLSPFGIIMKINRQPLPEVTEEMCRRDHEFWSQYSERFIGNWIKYETPVKEICEFAKRTYLRREHTEYKSDPKFVRDDNAQKAFSKLRGAIGGVYAWRVANTRNPVEQQRMVKEADFAYKQAFAFCPYSPEATFRYVQLLAQLGRVEDAWELASTAYEFDRENNSLRDLLHNLDQMRQTPAAKIPQVGPGAVLNPAATSTVVDLETRFKANPSNPEVAFALASTYFGSQRSADGFAVLDSLLNDPGVDSRVVLSLAEAYRKLNNVLKLEAALAKYTTMASNSPEAWYDYAAVLAAQSKARPAAENLAKAFDLNAKRLTTNSKSVDLKARFPTDGRFEMVRKAPEFQKFK